VGISLHVFGARYDLPISLALYLYAAGGLLVLSFVVMAAVAGSRTGERAVAYPRLRAPLLLALGRSRAVRALTGTIGVLGLLAVVVCGLLGSQDALRNPSQYLTWIVFWAGLVVVSGLVGNLWTLLDPWGAIHDLVTIGGRPVPRLRLPDGIGAWPAVAGYLLFVLFELASGCAARPAVVAEVAILYSVLTLAGMLLFGRDAWLQRCEGFTVLFGMVGRFGPVEAERDAEGRLTGVWLRPWGAGLLRPLRAGWDQVVFVILMLSSLAFDGILASPAWQDVDADVSPWLAGLGPLGQPAIRTLGFVVLSAAFLLVFVWFVRMVLALGRARRVELVTITAFALTLVPIALAYDAAHNYRSLLVTSQGLVPLLADPLARGWHLLPTAGYRPSAALAGPQAVWYAQVVLIVIGHVAALALAYLRAGQRFPSAQLALLSQYPTLLLMVLYAMTSLWILAQPTTL
jgi:hypothetical protein